MLFGSWPGYVIETIIFACIVFVCRKPDILLRNGRRARSVLRLQYGSMKYKNVKCNFSVGLSWLWFEFKVDLPHVTAETKYL